MDQFARAARTPELYEDDLKEDIGPLARAAGIVGLQEEDVEGFHWDHMAEYAAYLKSLGDKGREVS